MPSLTGWMLFSLLVLEELFFKLCPKWFERVTMLMAFLNVRRALKLVRKLGNRSPPSSVDLLSSEMVSSHSCSRAWCAVMRSSALIVKQRSIKFLAVVQYQKISLITLSTTHPGKTYLLDWCSPNKGRHSCSQHSWWLASPQRCLIPQMECTQTVKSRWLHQLPKDH